MLTVVTFVKLPSIVDPPNSDSSGLVLSASVTQPTPPNGKKLTVCIQGRQFIWRYTYGNGCLNNAFTDKLPYSYTTMVVPVHTTVVLDIQSTDVIHSWWIPEMGGKVDAVPGYTTYTWFKALHTGHVPRPVRAAVRHQPRGDDRLRQGGPAGSSTRRGPSARSS